MQQRDIAIHVRLSGRISAHGARGRQSLPPSFFFYRDRREMTVYSRTMIPNQLMYEQSVRKSATWIPPSLFFPPITFFPNTKQTTFRLLFFFFPLPPSLGHRSVSYGLPYAQRPPAKSSPLQVIWMVMRVFSFFFLVVSFGPYDQPLSKANSSLLSPLTLALKATARTLFPFPFPLLARRLDPMPRLLRFSFFMRHDVLAGR